MHYVIKIAHPSLCRYRDGISYMRSRLYRVWIKSYELIAVAAHYIYGMVGPSAYEAKGLRNLEGGKETCEYWGGKEGAGCRSGGGGHDRGRERWCLMRGI